ncbi:unnamed protein product, partial [Gulo gulo]
MKMQVPDPNRPVRLMNTTSPRLGILPGRCLDTISNPQSLSAMVKGKHQRPAGPWGASLCPCLPGQQTDTTSMAAGCSFEQSHTGYPVCP